MFRLFKRIVRTEAIFAFACLIFTIGQVWLELKIPDYMTDITRLIQTDGSTMTEIIKTGGWMLLCALLSLICAVIVGYISATLSSKFSYKVRNRIFSKVERFGLNEIKTFSTSSLITRTTNDVSQIEMFIAMGLSGMLRSPVMAVMAISKILNKGLEWTTLVALEVAFLLTVIIILMCLVVPKFKIMQKLIDRVNGVTRENLTGIRVIRAFNAEKYQLNRFEKENNKLTKTQMFNQKVLSLIGPTMNIVMHSLMLGIYIIGAILINKAGMMDKINLFSNMIVFSSYGMQVIMSFMMLSIIFMMWPRVSVSAGRINEILDTESSIVEGTFSGKTEEVGVVEFKNVSFKYPDADEYILKDISFKAEKGETVAFIGSTGSGKSTLINLVPRFYDVTEGTVYVDGVDVKEYKEEALYNKLGYVSQKAFMFTGTVKDNVSFGKINKRKATTDEIKKAVKIAQGKDFVEEMDKQYNAHIARGGTNISGGQKQRLSIARAIARNPEIYIFDDSFSALDYKTDSILRKELKKYTKDATSLIVAQRIGTIINADKIIVLDKGECVGIGTHKELLKNCEVYKEIALSQLSKEELENAA
ncbi:MAG: ABC transporter ATP-binding protein [Bacilli bacterium]|nr:ABC transporter ATP-binding protein [Bacilli bacterium]